MTLLVLVVIITIVIRFQCALYEAVLLSTRLGTLEAAKAVAGQKRIATRFIEMKKGDQRGHSVNSYFDRCSRYCRIGCSRYFRQRCLGAFHATRLFGDINRGDFISRGDSPKDAGSGLLAQFVAVYCVAPDVAEIYALPGGHSYSQIC